MKTIFTGFDFTKSFLVVQNFKTDLKSAENIF